MTEKIRTQQLTNEIQRISVELERVGLDKEKLVSVVDENKFKALESLMEETYTNTVTIKEQKITALESRCVPPLVHLNTYNA